MIIGGPNRAAMDSRRWQIPPPAMGVVVVVMMMMMMIKC